MTFPNTPLTSAFTAAKVEDWVALATDYDTAGEAYDAVVAAIVEHLGEDSVVGHENDLAKIVNYVVDAAGL